MYFMSTFEPADNTLYDMILHIVFRWDYELIKDTPYLALTSHLWCAIHEYFGKKLLCYKEVSLYFGQNWCCYDKNKVFLDPNEDKLCGQLALCLWLPGHISSSHWVPSDQGSGRQWLSIKSHNEAPRHGNWTL